MRQNYPLLSQEINDKLYKTYSDYVYLLGVETDSGNYEGLYDSLESSGLYTFYTPTNGIPHVSNLENELGLSYLTTSQQIVDLMNVEYQIKKYME